MSCRQPATASAAKPRANKREGRIRVVSLILHLHDRDRPKAFQKAARFRDLELGIVRFQAEKELIHHRSNTKIRRVEEWVIGLGQTAQGQHAKRSRKTGPENGPLVSRDDE